MPLSQLIGHLDAINITQCNSVVQNLIRFLGDSCMPNALQSYFNPFGDNTQEICRLCADKGKQAFCTSRDRFAGNQGALRCLHEQRMDPETAKRPSAAVVRALEIDLAIRDGTIPLAQYQLMCPTKQLRYAHRKLFSRTRWNFSTKTKSKQNRKTRYKVPYNH